MKGQRVLTALVFTDAVAFSTRVQNDEESALHEMQSDFDTMRDIAEAHGGRVLKSMGDGLLMVFDSAAQAVDAALEMQRRFSERPAKSLQHRMGVHLCDVVLEDHDAHGDGVNLAARLEAEASPGGICLSQTIYDIVKSRLPVQAKFLGERHLKNLVEPVNVFEIAPSNAPRGERIPPRNAGQKKTSPGIAAALVFVGICILVFAGVLWLRPQEAGRDRTYFLNPWRDSRPTITTAANEGGRRRIVSPPAFSGSIERERPAPASPRAPETPSPKPTQSSKSPAPPKKVLVPKVEIPILPGAFKWEEFEVTDPDELVNATSTLVKDAEYEAAVRRYTQGYEFDGMREWLVSQQALKERPDYSTELERWEKLSAVFKSLEEDLAGRTSENALDVDIPVNRGNAPAKIWGGGNGAITVMSSNGRTRSFKIKKLEPIALRALLVANAKQSGTSEEVNSAIIEFDRTFRPQYRQSLRGFIRILSGKGKGENVVNGPSSKTEPDSGEKSLVGSGGG